MENELCECGCGVTFIPGSQGFRLGILSRERNILYTFNEWKLAHDTWTNFMYDPWVFDNNDVIIQHWGEFQSQIIKSHFEKPSVGAWTHLFNKLCCDENDFDKNTLLEFEYIN